MNEKDKIKNLAEILGVEEDTILKMMNITGCTEISIAARRLLVIGAESYAIRLRGEKMLKQKKDGDIVELTPKYG